MTMTSTSSTQALADWSTSLAFEEIPAAVRRVAIRCLIDTLGVALAGAVTRSAASAQALVSESAAPGAAIVMGTTLRLAAPGAAFANATAAHALDFDDNIYAGFVHGSAVIVPAALAVAQVQRASGAELLSAIVAGAECQFRVGMALGRPWYDRGWWTTGMLGGIGACVASAKLLDLDVETTANALGLAISASAGMKCAFGSDAKALLVGRSAEAGVMAAMLAKRGASGPTEALRHRYGLAALCNDARFDAEQLCALPGRWCLLDPGIDIKRIPVCLSAHAAVDALRALVASYAIEPSEIDRIVCDVPPVVMANLIYPRPVDGQQAQFSLPFAIATALLFDGPTLEHLNRRTVTQARVIELMAMVEVVTGPRWRNSALLVDAPEGAWVEVMLRNGARHTGFVAKAHGSADQPLSDAALEEKFLDCAGRAMETAAARELVTRLWRLDTLSSLDDLSWGTPCHRSTHQHV